MRRVVITGLGMVSPLACGVEETWSRLLKSESGARKIEKFEVADLPSRIACQIPRGDGSNGTYNPDQWMEPKEQRKVDEFITYAMCAATQAIEDSGWKPTSYEDRTRTGVPVVTPSCPRSWGLTPTVAGGARGARDRDASSSTPSS